MDILIITLAFGIVALASHKIGKWFAQIGLPYITGYILAGAAAGPFILGLLPETASRDLRFVDEISIAIIAFIAGSELYIKEIRSRLKSITWVTAGVIVIALPAIAFALYFLTSFIPFAAEMPNSSRIAVSLLGSTILLALSPASTIAVIRGVRAKGPFTKTVLGITVSMDVVIIVLFAVAVAVASALLQGLGFNITFAGLLVIDLIAAVAAGYIVGRWIEMLLGSNMTSVVKIGILLATGFVVFAAAIWLVEFSYENLPFEIHIEPILMAMIAGFYVTNYTKHREQFADLLHDVSPMIYVAFFTLTGVSLKLDILLSTLPIAAALFVVRAIGIGAGSFLGGTFANETKKFKRYSGLGLITQAGIALGLAREVAVEFPTLGDSFATIVISVVVLNEIFGPIMLKTALTRAGETNLPTPRQRDEVRDALIFGIESLSIEVARQLRGNRWQVILADTNKAQVGNLNLDGVYETHIEAVDPEGTSGLFKNQIDAVVAMLDNDDDNLKAVKIAYAMNVPRIIVRPKGISLLDEFRTLGALIVEPTSAMVNLLDQSVRAPQSTAVLLRQDSGRDIVQITVNNKEFDGMLLRDLRLPPDVLFLEITRNGHAIVPNGHTHLHLKDDVTLLGQPDSLDELTRRIGF